MGSGGTGVANRWLERLGWTLASGQLLDLHLELGNLVASTCGFYVIPRYRGGRTYIIGVYTPSIHI
jgi:hypothetical protein